MTTHIQEQLPQLLALARRHTDDARAELAQNLADLFWGDEIDLAPEVEIQLNALIDALLEAQSSLARKSWLEKISNKESLPRLIALRLALGSMQEGEDVLQANEKLTDDDLVSIIEVKGSARACSIAKRRSISEAVVDALVLTGDLNVMQTVAENLGATLSARAVNVLTEAARLSTMLQEPMLQRPEMTTANALQLYWWVSQDLRRYALKRFGMTPSALEKILSDAINEKLAAHKLDRNKEDVMQTVANWLEERQVLNAKLLPQVLRLGHFRLFNIMLSRLTGLGLPATDAIVFESGGRSLAAVCRGIGIDKASFVSVFLLSRAARPGEHIVHPRELSYALSTFDRLSVEQANQMIDAWTQNPSLLLTQRCVGNSD